MLTDSGGFQVFSPRRSCARSTEEGVELPLAPRRPPQRCSRPRRRWRSRRPRRRHRHGVRRVPARRRRRATRSSDADGAHDPVGAALPRAPRRAPARRSSASSRAARRRSAPRHIAEDLRAAASRLRARRLLGRRADRRACTRSLDEVAPTLPPRPAALPHGRRHARAISSGDRRRHRHVRLRHADAQRAQRPALHLARGVIAGPQREVPRGPAADRLACRCHTCARGFTRAYLRHLFIGPARSWALPSRRSTT